MVCPRRHQHQRQHRARFGMMVVVMAMVSASCHSAVWCTATASQVVKRTFSGKDCTNSATTNITIQTLTSSDCITPDPFSSDITGIRSVSYTCDSNVVQVNLWRTVNCQIAGGSFTQIAGDCVSTQGGTTSFQLACGSCPNITSVPYSPGSYRLSVAYYNDATCTNVTSTLTRVNNTCISRGFETSVISTSSRYYIDVTSGIAVPTGGMTAICDTSGKTASIYSYDAHDCCWTPNLRVDRVYYTNDEDWCYAIPGGYVRFFCSSAFYLSPSNIIASLCTIVHIIVMNLLR